MKELLAKLSILTVARILGAGFAFLTTLLVTRHFGAAGVAQYATAFAAASILSVLMLIGFHAFAPVLAAEYRAKRQNGLLHGLVRTGLRNTVIASIAIAALVCCAIWGAPSLFDDQQFTLLVFAIATSPAIALVMFQGGILSGLQRQGQAQLPDSLARPSLMLALVASLVLFAPTAPLGWALALLSATLWLTAIVQAGFLWRALRDYSTDVREADRPRWRRMAPPWLTISLVWDYSIELFLLMAALIAAPVEIALLHICFRYRVLAGFGMRSIYTVCQPKIYTAIANADSAETQRMISITNLLSFSYAVATFIGLWLLGPWLLTLFGSEFSDGLALLLVVSASFVARSVFGPAMAILSSHDGQRVIAWVLGGSLVVALAVSAALYPSLGILGIGMAYTGANAVTAAMLWWIARQRTGIDTAIWAIGTADVRAELPTRSA